MISKPIPPPVPKKASPVKKPKPPPVRVPLTFVYGTSEKDQTKCVWDGNKKVTLLHFSEGVVVKEKVKEYWSVALAREKFWKVRICWSEATAVHRPPIFVFFDAPRQPFPLLTRITGLVGEGRRGGPGCYIKK